MPTLLTVAGSLRADSWNAKVLAQAAATVPSGWSIRAVTLHDIPLYNQDLEVDGAPAGVAELRAAVTTADAVLWSSPQYNHGVSGVVKNALDFTEDLRSDARVYLSGRAVGCTWDARSPAPGAGDSRP